MMSGTLDFWFAPEKLTVPGDGDMNPDLKKKVNNLERDFLHEVTQQLGLGRFHPLSKAEESYALNAKYRFSTAVSIGWNNFDKFVADQGITREIYGEFGGTNGNGTTPKYADCVLFFHRGVGL
eukprot:CAMPEP_0204841108 /NCGR_PEP_ID=MMETSP1346-20131115/40678_1 /ASSEMBLY_ACC=CAM_ASM_000771 /TAXON_ID=215587 /ORGANISM="Aplanochytrium stocchinoi, Strain GSBS06" /LENGTH=122 /DNA_ID=CAMNT_0051979019 /DNA_START=18 /DNA_END=386 /DNA_ORIENTATION=+